MEIFLFWFFLFGIIVAMSQDIKRREVDNWLNYFLLLGSFSFILFEIIIEQNFSLIYLSLFVLATVFVLMNAFYYGRVFGGGDAFLLFAMSAVFVGADFLSSIFNIGLFALLLMVSGSIYGIIFSAVLYSRNFRETNEEIKKRFAEEKKMILISAGFGILFFLLGFFNLIFLFFGVMFVLFPFFYIFARGLENTTMIREIPTAKLREGDWLVRDEKVGSKTVKSNWEGLSSVEIKILMKKKKVKIKEGIPFVPAFLVAFILYYFFGSWILGLAGI